MTVTGMIIGSIPGIFIVIVSLPALKLGYKVIANLPLLMIKSFVAAKINCFFVLLFFCIDFSFIVPGDNIHCLLTIFATVSKGLPFLSLIVMTRLAIFSGLICAMPSVSVYCIPDSFFGRLNIILGCTFCMVLV
ncbi:MAG: hypothetical protein WCL02_02935 [bacterium]